MSALLNRLVQSPGCNRPSLLQEHMPELSTRTFVLAKLLSSWKVGGSAQLVLLHQANLSQVHNSASASFELNVVSVSAFFQVVVVPLSSSLACQCF